MDGNDLYDLRSFVGRVDRLARCRIYELERVSVVEIAAGVGRPTSVAAAEPAEAILQEFISVLRPLIAQKDRTSLYRVFDHCRRSLDDAELARRAQEIRAQWREAQREGAMRIVVDDRHWDPETVADHVINAYFAHDDREKKQRLEALGPIGNALTRSLCIGYVTTTAAVAGHLAGVVRIGLRDRKFK